MARPFLLNRSHSPGVAYFPFAILMLATCSLAQQSADSNQQTNEDLKTRAAEIHSSGMLFDGHNDIAWNIRKFGGGSFDSMDIAVLQPKLHTDIPRLKQSGLKAQFWSVYVPADTAQTGQSLVQTLEQIQIVKAMVKRYPDVFEMAATTDDIERIVHSGKIASMMGIEGGHAIQDSLPVLHQLYDEGCRYMTLTHNMTLSWADAATDEHRHGGLTPFGEEVVREMNRLGMLVDLSHVSAETMADALGVTQAPVIFSHSSARAINHHPRNVPDEILHKLPGNGGVVMVNFMSGFVVPSEILERDPDARGDVATVVDHIDHIVKVAGIDHVGIGADYDGVTTLPVGLEDVSCYPAITRELVRRGYGAEQIHKILGGNVLRVLKEAELVSARLRQNP